MSKHKPGGRPFFKNVSKSFHHFCDFCGNSGLHCNISILKLGKFSFMSVCVWKKQTNSYKFAGKYSYWLFGKALWFFTNIFFPIKVRDFYFYNHELKPHEKYANESNISSSCAINTREHPCKLSPAIKFRLLVNMSQPYVQIQGKDLIRDKIVADQIVNFCMMSSHGGMDILTRIGIELIRKSVNFDLGCPVKKVNEQKFPTKN